MEKSKAMSRRPITSSSKYNNNKQNVVIFYKERKKYNEIQLTKNKMEYSKNCKSYTLPRCNNNNNNNNV